LSEFAGEFGIREKPFTALIDLDGRFAFMGHPLSRFIEEDIDKLLSKIPLEAPETPIEMKEQPHDVMVEEIEQFK